MEECDDVANVSVEKSLKEKALCSVCHDAGDGLHFGAEACRACAAFFRRTVSMEKKYVCRANGECDVTTNIRCICRSCRYTKCLQVGMNPSGVQQRRESLGRRDFKEYPFDMKSTMSFQGGQDGTSNNSGVIFESIPMEENMPLLMRIKSNYTKMDNARLAVHRRDTQNMFGQRIPKCVTYKEAAETSKKEVTLVAEWISFCFEDFVKLHVDQKKILFRNFFILFTMLESAYLCHINSRSNVVILPSGDFIDIENLEKFFKNSEEGDSLSSKDIERCSRIYKSSFDMFRRSLIIPMMKEKVNVFEFFTLCTLMLWDFGFIGQSDECIELGTKIKNCVIKELTFYLKYEIKIEEPSLRIANLLSILPPLQRCARRFQEDVEISAVFNLYAPSEDFYNIVNGKFC